MLYHVKRTLIDPAAKKSGIPRTVDILGTYTNLGAAKQAASTALLDEGYTKGDFELYEEYDSDENPIHGSGVRVYAKSLAGSEFEVSLDTKYNELGLRSDDSGEVKGILYYVLQTTINYNNSQQTTEVEGTYLDRRDAWDAAMVALTDDEVTESSFDQYNEKEKHKEEWPYGDDVFVHAVSETGEHFLVAVKAKKSLHRKVWT